MKIKIESKYLIPGVNVNHRDVLTILNEGGYVPSQRDPDGEDRLQLTVKLPGGEEKLASPNQTSVIEMVRAWGDDSKEWVGQKVAVKIGQQRVFGEDKLVIYLVPISKKKSAVGEEREPSQKELDETFGTDPLNNYAEPAI